MDATIKTRKQGNSLTLTVPSSFNITEGTTVKPKLTPKGIFYEFVEEDDFLNFDEEILSDILKEDISKYQILDEFKKRRKEIRLAFEKIEAETDSKPLTRQELKKEIGL